MATIIAALIGFLALVLATFLSIRATRRIESRKQSGELAAVAFVDLMHAYAENSEANAVLRGSSADSLLQDPSEIERSDFVKRLVDSRVRAIAAKNRLMAFGSTNIAEAAHAALASERTVMADADTQRALCELIQRIREDLFPHQPRLPDRSIIEMMFGADASSLSSLDKGTRVARP